MFASRLARTVLVAAIAVAAVPAFSQAPPGGGPPGGRPPGGMGMMQMDRASVQQRMALDTPGLNLTAAQKSQIDKLTDDYIAEQTKLREKYPMTQGTPPSQEMMTAMRGARDNFNAAVGKVLNDTQRKSWEAALAARPQMGPGMGPPGGGAPPPR